MTLLRCLHRAATVSFLPGLNELTGEPLPEPSSRSRADDEARFDRFVDRNLPRNFAAHLVHGLLGQTGFRLVQAPTFLPAYLELLSGSPLIVGLARGAQSLAQSSTPFLTATLVEHRRRLLPLGFLVGILMRLQVLFFALAGFFLDGNLRIAALIFFLALFGLFMGMQGVIFNTLMSKVIPVSKRGALTGLRNGLAGLVAATVAMLGATYLIAPNVFGNGYSVVFLIAFVLTSLGLCSLLFLREPAAPTVRKRSRVAARVSELPALLRSDPDFGLFVIARTLGRLGQMSLPFCILYASARVGIDAVGLGIVTTAWMLANTCTNIVWGLLADRTGFRRIFLFSIVLWMLSVALLMTASNLASVILVFVGIGAGMAGFQMAEINMVLEFGTREDLPLRIATANSSAELAGAIGPIAGGLVAASTSYPVVFWIAIGFQMASFLLMLLRVREPRHRSR